MAGCSLINGDTGFSDNMTISGNALYIGVAPAQYGSNISHLSYRRSTNIRLESKRPSGKHYESSNILIDPYVGPSYRTSRDID